MRLSKTSVQREISHLEFTTENNYLRLVLESYFSYNHRARLDIAETLYEKLLALPETSNTLNKRCALFAEIYVKLMESLEDLTVLALMFTEQNKTPLQVFTENATPNYYAFLGRAKRGLSDRTLYQIYGFQPVRTLLRRKFIEPSEVQDFQHTYDLLFHSHEGERRRWQGFGRVYTEPWIDPKGKVGHRKSGAVSAYHNIKHAYKILLPTDIFRKLWFYDDSRPILAVFEKYIELNKLKRKIPKEFQPYRNRKLIMIGSFTVNRDTAKEIFERIHPSAQTLQQIAEMQLNLLDDPQYPTRELRFYIHRMKGLPDPKPFEMCPCGGTKKFKKCHRDKFTKLESLIFNPNKYKSQTS